LTTNEEIAKLGRPKYSECSCGHLLKTHKKGPECTAKNRCTHCNGDHEDDEHRDTEEHTRYQNRDRLRVLEERKRTEARPTYASKASVTPASKDSATPVVPRATASPQSKDSVAASSSGRGAARAKANVFTALAAAKDIPKKIANVVHSHVAHAELSTCDASLALQETDATVRHVKSEAIGGNDYGAILEAEVATLSVALEKKVDELADHKANKARYLWANVRKLTKGKTGLCETLEDLSSVKTLIEIDIKMVADFGEQAVLKDGLDLLDVAIAENMDSLAHRNDKIDEAIAQTSRELVRDLQMRADSKVPSKAPTADVENHSTRPTTRASKAQDLNGCDASWEDTITTAAPLNPRLHPDPPSIGELKKYIQVQKELAATKVSAVKTPDATKAAAVKTPDATKAAAAKTPDATKAAAAKTPAATKASAVKTPAESKTPAPKGSVNFWDTKKDKTHVKAIGESKSPATKDTAKTTLASRAATAMDPATATPAATPGADDVDVTTTTSPKTADLKDSAPVSDSEEISATSSLPALRSNSSQDSPPRKRHASDGDSSGYSSDDSD
jgi:hypothetical protein